jgi:hypothetical protein
MWSTAVASPLINSAARDAFAAFDQIGVEACLVGGFACKLYGNIREPGVRLTFSPQTRRRIKIIGRPGYRHTVSYQFLEPRISQACTRAKELQILPGPFPRPHRNIPGSLVPSHVLPHQSGHSPAWSDEHTLDLPISNRAAKRATSRSALNGLSTQIASLVPAPCFDCEPLCHEAIHR